MFKKPHPTKRPAKCQLICLALIVLFAGSCDIYNLPVKEDIDYYLNLVKASSYNELRDAVYNAPDGSVIALIQGFPMTGPINMSSGKTITLTTLGGSSVTLARGAGFLGKFFDVSAGSGLILGDSRNGAIVLDGQTGSVAEELLYVAGVGSVITMNAGVELWRNNGRGVFVEDSGAFIMTGGTIRNNTAATEGAGVHVYSGDSYSSTFTMTGGTIINNTATTNGGGVYVYNSPFTMTGGTIIDNRAAKGGGLYLEYGGTTFTMRGGSIRDNIAATNGGGVYMVSSAFDMYRGSISGNKASSGGGVYKGGGTFILYGGAISGNTAEDATTAYGGGVCVDNGGFSMHGGAISGNTVKGGSLSLGGGVYVGSSGSFTKVPDGGGATSGIIHGFDSGAPNHNRVMDTSVPPVHQPGNGDAVYKVSTTQKREKTVGEDEHEPTTTNPLFWIDP